MSLNTLTLAPKPKDTLEEAVLNLFRDETQRIVAEEAANAAKRVEERVRGMSGEIAARVATFVDFERIGQNLVISVKLPNRKTE